MIFLDAFDLFASAEDERDPLVHSAGHDIEQTHRTLSQVYADVLLVRTSESGQQAKLQSDFPNNLRS